VEASEHPAAAPAGGIGPPITAASFPASPPDGVHGHAGPRRLVFTDRATFLWKTTLLAVTTVALVPILLWQHELAAKVYLWALVVVHVAGIFVVGIGVRRHQIAPDRRGLYIRLLAIAILIALLYLAAQGLEGKVGGVLFWGSLFAIWALHTLGLVLLHLRSQREQRLCPFV
jgi:ABC-type transport system involved in cytochrome c biogenesis permease component